MKMTATNRAISIVVFTLIAFNGLFLFGNGLFMLTVPRAWYYSVGKTITDEFAFSLVGENHFYGTPLNPKAPDRIPGGSSSGSASVVAAGQADFALGTDTAGSIRVPAANCGIFGLRPTWGRISMAGVQPLAPSFDTVGFLPATRWCSAAWRRFFCPRRCGHRRSAGCSCWSRAGKSRMRRSGICVHSPRAAWAGRDFALSPFRWARW
jgi:amidase